MTQELQIKATIIDLESKTDKNQNPYCRISLQGLNNRYFYAFNNSLSTETFTSLTNSPHHFINRPVLITYQELPNKDQPGVFFRVKEIQIT